MGEPAEALYMFGHGWYSFDFYFPGLVSALLSASSPLSTRKSPGQKKKKGMWGESHNEGVQQVDRRCTTCRLRIQKGITGRDGTKQDDFV